jgi:type II secretory pathway pseudopilin PulG
MKLIKNNQGFSLIELLISIAFVAVSAILILHITTSNNNLRRVNEEKLQAIFYAAEAIEAVHMMDWDDVVVGSYYPTVSGDTFVLNAGSEIIDSRYTRTIAVEDVYRQNISNGNVYGDIGGANLDVDTKKVIATIDWTSVTGVSKQEFIETYIYRWQANRWSQTDWIGGDGQADWSSEAMFASKSSGIDISTAGMTTLLSGFLDWNQGTTTDTYNVPGSLIPTDIFELDDITYVTYLNNSGYELFLFDTSDIYNVTLLDGLSLGGLNGVVVKDDYAYLAGRNNSNELRIVDVSDPNDISIIGSYNLDGSSNSVDVAVDETEAYIIRDDKLYSFSILDPADPQLLDEFDIDDEATAMFLSEDYIYVSADDGNRELQIFDITNPANLDAAGYFDLPDSLAATDIYVQGNRAYISTEVNSSGEEFYIFDISDPSDPMLIGDYELGDTIYAFTIIGPYALLGSSDNNEELVVIDVSFPSTINRASDFNLDGYLYALAANCSNVFTGTSNTSEEFLVFSTEEVDCGYADSGNLESSTFDTGSDNLAYNWISWSGTEPLNTTIRFQLATSDNSSGPWTFGGPDGTTNTYYTTAAHEFINYSQHQDERYLRYKLYLDTQAGLQAPILEEVIISYSTYE